MNECTLPQLSDSCCDELHGETNQDVFRAVSTKLLWFLHTKTHVTHFSPIASDGSNNTKALVCVSCTERETRLQYVYRLKKHHTYGTIKNFFLQSVERLFSKAGKLVSKTQNCIGPNMIKKKKKNLFLNKNWYNPAFSPYIQVHKHSHFH